MASNIDITLKRYNGTDYDTILPTTHLGQLYTDNTLATSLADFLTNTYINVNQIGAANGLATLDSNQKLTLSQLPNGITGGLKFGGTLTQAEVDGAGATLAGKIDTLHQNVGIGNFVGLQGSYFVATEEVTFVASPNEVQAGSTGRYYTWSQADPNEEGVSGGDVDTITLEIGDWLLIRSIGGIGEQVAPYTISFATINNTYGNATDSEKGIVTLSNITNLASASGNNVITDGILAGLIGTATGEIAAGDHLHDDRYYTETEIGNFFDGTTAITGYNKTDWDTAYEEKINSASFNTADGVLTLTQEAGSSFTVDLDGRYLEGLTAAQTDSTDGIVIANTGQDFTVAHADTSSVSDVTNTNGSVIQSMTFDTFGHLQTHATVDLDSRYYTETEINNWIDGSGTINGDTYVPILYGAAPTSSITGALIIDID